MIGSSRRFSTQASRRGPARWALVAGLGLAIAIGGGVSGARAADDDDDALPDVQALRSILKHLGLRRDEKQIDYRERSPLVLPPSKEQGQLPAPETNTAPKTKTAAWPDDPDVKRAKQRRDDERNRKPFEYGVDDRPLLPSQYQRGGGQSGAGQGGQASRGGEAPGKSWEDTSKPSTQQELGAKSIFSNIGSIWQPKEEYTTFTYEPPRSSLTEPPAGYRTPSPSQPYGIGRETWKPGKVDRQEPVK